MSKSKAVESIALARVPPEQRQHWSSVAAIQAGYLVSVSGLITGAQLALGLPLTYVVLAGVIGYAVIVALAIPQGIQGRDLGVPSVEVATSAFGEQGSRWIVSTILAASTVGWFAINAHICGVTFAALLTNHLGIPVPTTAAVIGWGLVMLSTAVLGFQGLKYLNMVGVPLMIGVCAYSTYLALSSHGFGPLLNYTPTGGRTLASAVAVVVGSYAVGAVTAADTNRYQRSRRHVALATTVGILPAGVMALCAGAALGVIAKTPDLAGIFVKLGIPVLGVVAVVMSTWAANAGNAYSAGINAVKLFGLPDSFRAAATIGCGIIGIIAACFDVLGLFLVIMETFGVVVTPLCGVMIADYWLRGRGSPQQWRAVPGFRIPGMIAWAVGVAIGHFVTFGVPILFGMVAAAATDLALGRIWPAPPAPDTTADGGGRHRRGGQTGPMPRREPVRELGPVEITDLITGACVLGTGGGGSLAGGLETVRPHLESGRPLRLASLQELPDDEWIACPYAAGAATGGKSTTPTGDTSALASFIALEDYLGLHFHGVISTELGAENTADAVHVAVELGIVLVDADPAGRSVPELQHSTFSMYGVPIAPLAVATAQGDVALLSKVGGDTRAEALVRAMAVASGDEIGVASHPIRGADLRDVVIPGAISKALAMGEALRMARASGADVAEALAAVGGGAVRFRGRVIDLVWQNQGGFTVGHVEFGGVGSYSGSRYQMWFKNEYLVSSRDGIVDVTVPDLLCVVEADGQPVTNPNYAPDREYVVFALPAPEPWKTPAGVELFGPRSFGFDIDYVPFEKVVFDEEPFGVR
ncbi:DUF917 family protein [Austwickia chelonae]|uniref:S-methyl thiohydantoin desulfurase domain-containing protein n=1 Tax=Austwickia chelonae TaxID=100225 RepID=UPI0013C2AB7E|nr:DUF917 family protein [Austwickia chelonae]